MQYEFTGGTSEVFPTLAGRELAVYRESDSADVLVRDATLQPGDIVTLDEPIVHARLVPVDSETGRATAMQALADNPGDILDPVLAEHVPELFDVVEEPVTVDDTDNAVPDGNRDEVLAWVGDDPERAARAREHEQSDDGKHRSSLLNALDDIIINAAASGEGSEG